MVLLEQFAPSVALGLFDPGNRLVVGAQTTSLLFGRVGGFMLFGSMAVFSTVCLFLPNRILLKPALVRLIGTENPWVARIACLIGAVVGWMAVALAVASLSDAAGK